MSKSLRSSLLLAGALTCALSIDGGPITPANFSSNATIINFDGLAGGACNLCGPSVTNQYAGMGITFYNPSLPGQDTADNNLTPLIPNSSSPNVLFVSQGGMLTDPPALPFQFLFSTPVTKVGFDYGSSTASYLELDAYDPAHHLIETMTFIGSPAPIGLAGFAGLQETVPIAELDVSYHPFSDPLRTLNFSVDNIEFEGNSVPEPSTFALFAAGGLGLMCGFRVVRSGRQ